MYEDAGLSARVPAAHRVASPIGYDLPGVSYSYLYSISSLDFMLLCEHDLAMLLQGRL